MKKMIITLVLIAALLLLSSSISGLIRENTDNPRYELVEKSQDFEHYREGNSHKLTLYEGVNFVQEDGIWKEVEHARNLNNKGFEMKYLEQDDNFIFSVTEFNYTSFSGVLEVSNDFVGKNIPVRFYEKESYNSINITKTSAELSIPMNQRKETIYVDLKPHLTKNLFEYVIHIGQSSTVVTFQPGGSANYTGSINDSYLDSQVADTNLNAGITWAYWESGSTRHADFRFGLTQIPAGSSIEEANLTVVSINVYGGTSVMGAYCMVSHVWLDSQDTWNVYTTGNSWTTAGGDYNTTAESTVTETSSGTRIFNVTKCIQQSYGATNYGILLRQTTEGSSSHGSSIYTSQAATASNRPKLTVRYSLITEVTNETVARSAIEAGINGSSINSGSTRYTDQQAYIRYLNATQKKGTFDIMVVYGLQRWLLNYKTGSETLTSMKNLGTTANIWENQTLTATQITSQVETLINGTKQS